MARVSIAWLPKVTDMLSVAHGVSTLLDRHDHSRLHSGRRVDRTGPGFPPDFAAAAARNAPSYSALPRLVCETSV